MFTTGRLILTLLAGILTFASPYSDLNAQHVFNPSWPGHARFHGAAHALLNSGIGALCLWLLFLGIRHDIYIAGALLALSGLSLLIAGMIPTTDAVADGERVWKRLPVSLWGTFAYLALDVIALVMIAVAAG